MPDKYGDVIIPMTIIRRFECALLDDEVKRKDVIDTFKSGFQFYNTSEYTLQELCNDADHVAANFKALLVCTRAANLGQKLRRLV